jgi:2-keto-4-pentenoate hydratase/2-oxohepta-3-ene-1,7-dioic acid hydratase in catechol pathway
MFLASFGDHSAGIVRGWIQGAGLSSMRYLIQHWAELHDQVPVSGGPPAPLSSARLRAPVPDPTKIVAAPINYVDHKNEMSQTSTVADLGTFLKAPSSLLDPGGTVQLPYSDRRFDQEGELALIIGRRAREVSEQDALEYVFGYTGLLDITMRGGEDRSTRKSFDTFTPMGPWIATADHLGDPGDVELECLVAGDKRQHINTGELIWGVARLVSYVSSVMTLEPGDVITTGTPAGVGPLEPGDNIVLRLSGIGELRVAVASDHPTLSATRGSGRGPVPPPQPRSARSPARPDPKAG